MSSLITKMQALALELGKDYCPKCKGLRVGMRWHSREGNAVVRQCLVCGSAWHIFIAPHGEKPRFV